MLLNEHMSKTLFQQSGIPVPPGMLIHAGEQTNTRPPFPLPWYLKAQVPAGGRGKAGGILRVDHAEAFIPAADTIFGLTIKEYSVPLLRVEPACDIEREFYLSLSVSRPRSCLLLTVGRKGGVEIEHLGAANLLTQEIHLPGKIEAHQARAAFFHLGLEKELFSAFNTLLGTLFHCFMDNGLLLAEINPLILDKENRLLALDGKVEVDDNFLDLNPSMERYYQREHATSEENKARDAGLSFVRLPGWVGLVVNGAGLAMATMDALNFSGLPASNFLDLGGGADQQRMRIALDLLFEDPHAKAVFINLFGGILSCEKVAQALKGALDGQAPPKAIVIRMAGKDAESGLNILRNLGEKNLHIVSNMREALEILRQLAPDKDIKPHYPDPEPPSSRSTQTTGSSLAHNLFEIKENTQILVQGITGREGRLHTRLMLDYGANIVAGVTPFKGGQTVEGVPVYDSVAQAGRRHDIGASIIFVPPARAADAILEAAENRVPLTVCITEGIPQHEMIAVLGKIHHSPTRIIGPNTPGIILPGGTKIGIMPTTPFTSGPVAILSRSGTLTYEVAYRLSSIGIGQSICIGIGGDPFVGTSFIDLFEMIRNHDKTEVVVVLGEIGGQAEENLAEYVRRSGFDKPVISFIAGRTAPAGKRLGHAGAILEQRGGIEQKLKAMRKAGFALCPSLRSIAPMTQAALKNGK